MTVQGKTQFWITQIAALEQMSISEYNLSNFSGSQGFLVLIAGVLLAFAFQILLSNFFIALGSSYSDSTPLDSDVNDDSSLDNKIARLVW